MSDQASTLAQQERRLAQLELGERARRTAGVSIGALAVAGAVGFFGVLWLLAAIVLALDTELKSWASAALVGLILVAVAAAVAVAGKK